MASFITQAETKRYLDSRTNSVYYAPGDSEIVFFTTPPTKVGTDGTELTGGGYARVTVGFGTAVNGSAGRTGQTSNDVGFTVTNMPVASTSVVGYALADSVTHEIWFVNDSWTPTNAFAVGGNMNVAAGALVLFGNN